LDLQHEGIALADKLLETPSPQHVGIRHAAPIVQPRKPFEIEHHVDVEPSPARRPSSSRGSTTHLDRAAPPDGKEDLASERRRSRAPSFDTSLVIIDYSELELGKCIGGGAFGQVYKGSWRGTPVAIKVLPSACQKDVPPQFLEAFEDETAMLARLRHPNVCLFMGASLAAPNRAIVMELVPRGSVWEVLRMPELFRNHTGPGPWPIEIVGKVAIGTAMGLSYLHGHFPPIIHRDLKSANLLLDESFNVKVCVHCRVCLCCFRFRAENDSHDGSAT
jgi:serine/threonine protein kinase